MKALVFLFIALAFLPLHAQQQRLSDISRGKTPAAPAPKTKVIISATVHELGSNVNSSQLQEWISETVNERDFLVAKQSIFQKSLTPAAHNIIKEHDAQYLVNVYQEAMPQKHNGPGSMVDYRIYINVWDIAKNEALGVDTLFFAEINAPSLPDCRNILYRNEGNNIKSRITRVVNRALWRRN